MEGITLTILYLISIILNVGAVNYYINNLKYSKPTEIYLFVIIPFLSFILLKTIENNPPCKLKGKQPFLHFKLLKRNSDDERIKDTYYE